MDRKEIRLNQRLRVQMYYKQRQVLAAIIDDIMHDMIVLSKELDKAPNIVTSARKARVITIGLQKNFKKFRKVSCEMGLK